DRRSRSAAAPANPALGLGLGRRSTRARGYRDDVLPAMDRQFRGDDVAAGNRGCALFWRQLCTANQPAAAGRDRPPGRRMKNCTGPGRVVVCRPPDTSGTPPADIAQRFPGLVPEVPRAFERLANGRQPLFWFGWGIVG